jgi:transcriptional regulator with XRE-family HTH domain
MLSRRRLAKKLRQMRADAQLTLEDAATKLDRSRSALSRIEKAQTVADIHFVRSAMDVYDVRDPDAIELARAAMRPGWWQAYGAPSDDVRWETDAVRSLELASMRLPTLLQIEDYSRALLECRGEWSCARLEDELAMRQVRQRRLTDTDWPLALTVLVDESALRKSVGGPEVMRVQLRELLTLAAGDSVTMLVLPDSLGGYEGMDSAFTVLEFEDDQDPDIVFLGTVIGPRQLDKPADVTGLVELFNNLCSLALSRIDSLDFVEQLGKQLYGA